MEFFKNLGLSRDDLLPTNTPTWNINKIAIDIMGTLIMEIKVEGKYTVIKQIVHLTSNTNEVFLSREACEQLGLTIENSPRTGVELNHVKIKELQHTQPKGIAKLPLPTEMLGETMIDREENQKRIPMKTWILDGYINSTVATKKCRSRDNLVEENHSPVRNKPPKKAIGQQKFQYPIDERDEISNKPTHKEIEGNNLDDKEK